VPDEEHVMSLSEGERQILLEIAGSSVRAAVSGTSLPAPPEDISPALRESRGAFVTLTRDRKLRGCIGLIESNLSLTQTVIKMAKAAATEDMRFPPLRPEELNEIVIEISALSRLQKAASARDIVLGRDGVMVRAGGRSGVFLPQVAKETGWDLERFLSELCSGKAGLPGNAWRSSETELYTFTAEVFQAPITSR